MKTKRIIGILLTLTMIIGLLPITASAVVVEGTCGDNAKWKYDDTTNTLTIFGKGAMADYYLSSRPWSDYYNDVTTVVVERGITHIGGDSFYALTNLTTVTIADTVETIANRVFANCEKLTSIKLPDSVKSIGTTSVFECVRTEQHLSPLLAPTIFGCTCISHLFGASSGREGAALQIGGGVADSLSKLFKLCYPYRKRRTRPIYFQDARTRSEAQRFSLTV